MVDAAAPPWWARNSLISRSDRQKGVRRPKYSAGLKTESSQFSLTYIFQTKPRPAPSTVDPQWLRGKCGEIGGGASGLSSHDIFNGIRNLILNQTGIELESGLIELVGLEQIELVSQILAHRAQLLSGLASLSEEEEEIQAYTEPTPDSNSNPLSLAGLSQTQIQYPHVFQSSRSRSHYPMGAGGATLTLPAGSVTLQSQTSEEVVIPAANNSEYRSQLRLLPIKELDGLGRMTFPSYKTLNPMQTLVYPVAYKTNENMLICAPTGAGKTDVAVITILSIVRQYVSPNPMEDNAVTSFQVELSDFKIVYVAPMKALAREVTEKLGSRLGWLGIRVRELTGDTQMSKAELHSTQIIVTTPEKWDIVTRKGTGDKELVQKVRLLIIDEVHMLHDERGAVIESLVARTQRQVESTQSMIRIVGLSATLPNYIDVAEFLKVNPMSGMFFFDQAFRPVPLEQHFIGVKGKARSKTFNDNLEQVTYDKIMDILKTDPNHQVMVFVHSRKDTVKSARSFLEKLAEEGDADTFDVSNNPNYKKYSSNVMQSRSREIRELVGKQLGIHHAGMPRTDRNLVENLFSAGVLKILFCTATLAWGVNLPAAAVIIKGTQVYNPQAGKHIDLSILDVVQIFGRAGRPQFQTTGIGFIVTQYDRLRHYITAVTQQLPIESNFSKFLCDNLNAEVALGTVTSVTEAVQWLGYSYLIVRMRKNPVVYGITQAELEDDPTLVGRRRKLIIEAATALQFSQMIIFNEATEELKPKVLGQIASQYYISNKTVRTFNKEMHPNGTEADILNLISLSDEFEQIRSRDSEEADLSKLLNNAAQCQIPGGVGTPQAKTNILLQAYISRARLDDFTLSSDMAYVAQNAGRISRALFLIALNRKWGDVCLGVLGICKAIEKQLWPFQHPLCQFDLPAPVMRQLDGPGNISSIQSLREMDAAELGHLVRNQKVGKNLVGLLNLFPLLELDATLEPLTHHILRIKLTVTPDFNWNERHHGFSESFWIWVENSESGQIYHHENFILTRGRLREDHQFLLTIPLEDPLPSQIYIRAVSDRWLGAETVQAVSFQHLIRPDVKAHYTDLLDLQPLPLSALKNPLLEDLYRPKFSYFNPMQTQIFHTLYNTDENVFLGSPTGSGKTVAAELALWWAFREKPGSKVVYIAPMKALVRERVMEWKPRLVDQMGLRMVELTGDNAPDAIAIRKADIIVSTPEKWDVVSRSWLTRTFVQAVSLVIIDEIHLLGGDRGPVLETIVSRMRYIASANERKVRVVGLSTACTNALDLGEWLGVRNGLFNFRHSIRPVPLEAFIEGFPQQRGFCVLMESMNRPTFLAIKTHSPTKPVIVFVPSRRQTRLTAKDLINFCALEDNPRRFSSLSEEELIIHQSRASDPELKECLAFGIGVHHAGLVESDRSLSEELFLNGKIQILVATSTLAWGVNLPAHLVVVKGTQFFDAKTQGYKDMDLTDVLQMMGRAGRPKFDTSGTAVILTLQAKKEFYKHFLHTGFPVESSLHKVLDDHFGAEIAGGTIRSRKDCLDYISCTFFYQRLSKNPSYYGLTNEPEYDEDGEEMEPVAPAQSANDYLKNIITNSLNSLQESRCIEVDQNMGSITSTPLGKIMAHYYISHRTIRTIVTRLESKPTPGFGDVLALLSLASEYDEAPVRHNEELINAELLKAVPLALTGMDDLPLWDPHVKAFALLQAHFSRLPLPIADYVTDLNSVLDQSIRVVQALIDVFAELRSLTGCLRAIALLQAIKSACWPAGFESSAALLPAAKEKVKSEEYASYLISGSAEPDSSVSASDVRKVMDKLPVLEFSAGSAMTSATNGASRAEISLKVHRKKPFANKSGMVYAPRFPKPQNEGFIVLMTSALAGSEGALLGLARLSWPMKEQKGAESTSRGGGPAFVPERTILAKMPVPPGHERVKMTLLSDAYPDMEWETEVEVARGGVLMASSLLGLDDGLQKKGRQE